jgi:deoxyguanosine kinase
MNQVHSTTENLRRTLRIEICGGIASGKTTFATLLKHAGIDATLENFQTNPFWEAFYQDPVRHAFETEVTFLLQHYHQIKVNGATAKVFACDFSLLLDRAYANVTLHGSKRQTFLAVYKEAVRDLGLPDVLVHLQCGAAAELQRIRKRGRAVEESITLEYLDKLNDSVAQQVSLVGKQTQVLTIDSEHKNFADDRKVQQDLINEVLRTLPKGCLGTLGNETELP